MSWLPDVDHEIWLPVVGFVGLYEIARDSRVRSVDRFVERTSRRDGRYQGGYRWQYRRGVVRQPHTTKSGRRQVVLYDASGKRHTKSVDRLVAEAWGEAA